MVAKALFAVSVAFGGYLVVAAWRGERRWGLAAIGGVLLVAWGAVVLLRWV